MNFWTIIVLVVTATTGISTVSAEENSHEDASSIASLASGMKQLLENFARLETKVNRILEQGNFHAAGAAAQENGSDGSNVDTATTGSAEAQNENLLNQVKHLHKLLSERASN